MQGPGVHGLRGGSAVLREAAEKYTLWVNQQLDPENDQFIVETNLPTPMTGRVYVNLLEGIAAWWFGTMNVICSILYMGCHP